MRAPGFWQRDGLLPRLLAPAGALYGAGTALRLRLRGWRAPVPVVCCGNATAGGSGKTTVALDIGARLLAHGRHVAFLTRGYGGRGAVRRVDPLRDGPAAVGDEPLLLAGLAPTFAGADRAAAAKLAVEWGAQALVMDDGLQNPRLIKDLSLLVIDGAAGFGNRRLIPAGPLREPVAAAADRCDTAIIIGHDDHGVERSLGLRALHARLEAAEDLSGMRVLAFAGIGRPEKFFATCAAAGAEIAATRSFPDHHRFTARETEALLREAVRLGATPVTTPKDAVRLPAALRAQVRVIGVRLVWSDEAALETLLAPVLKPRR